MFVIRAMAPHAQSGATRNKELILVSQTYCCHSHPLYCSVLQRKAAPQETALSYSGLEGLKQLRQSWWHHSCTLPGPLHICCPQPEHE